MSILNERIKLRRLALNMTLLYIAECLGVKEATVQRYESGEIKNIKHETIVQLAEILKCSPAYLMGWQDSPSSINTTTISTDEAELLMLFKALNNDGRKKLIERAEELMTLGFTASEKGDAVKMA